MVLKINEKSYTDFYIKIILTYLFFVFFIQGENKLRAQSFPSGFSAPLFKGGWSEVEGFRFDVIGQMYVWEKGGKVWIVDTNGVKLSTPLLNISDEVGNWRDHGLNGFALDPNFRTNGYYYLYYTVDRHYLMNFGTPNYNPATNNYFSATISRVTRYTADPATNFTTTIAGSRLILIGEDKKTGMCVLHETHSGGQLVFGTDGSLLVSTGDGGTAQLADSGGTAIMITYWQQALADTIIIEKENIGGFRSQLMNCLSGKILRINPANGNGLSSNPYYDPANPRAAKSRVWCLGLRNPIRMTLRPGTGNTDSTAGDPGVIYLGDVGWDTWEDLHVVTGPGLNFGWPLYEGLTPCIPYQNVVNQFNADAPNPLFGTGGCTKQFFKFKELLIQATLTPSWPNPCNAAQQIPSGIPHFIHTRPAVDWNHSQQITRTGIYSGNNAAEINLNHPNSPVPGPMLFAQASIAGVWYPGTKYPSAYQNIYFHSDYAQGFLLNFNFNSSNNPVSVSTFGVSYGNVVFLEYNPKDQFIYYVQYPSNIFKLVYSGSVNNPPTAVAAQSVTFGFKPLLVNFTGNNSTDPENLPLSYSWNFGDGTSNSSAPNPSHTFNPATNNPVTFIVTLKVTDNIGQTSTDTLKVYVNNSPPQVTITSFNNGDLYTMSHNTILPLQASVTDAQSAEPLLNYNWQTFLHHNQHEHPESADTNRVTSTLLTPVGCDENTFYYRIELTVTDPQGLSTIVQGSLYPACDPPIADFTSNVTSGCPGTQVNFTDQSSNLPDSWSWSFPGGSPSTSTLQNPVVTYSTSGTRNVTLTVTSTLGTGVTTKTGYITIHPNPAATVSPPGNDSICPGASFLLSANTGSNLAYQWIKNGTDIAGATSSSYSATATANYKVRVANTTTGCVKTSANKRVVVRSLTAAITANGPLTLCNGDSVVLSANPGYAYQWKKNANFITGATEINYVAKTAGNYRVQVTGPGGCTKLSPLKAVTVNCKLMNADGEKDLPVLDAGIYPNPVNCNSTINIVMSREGVVSIIVLDASGRQVQSVADHLNLSEGKSEISFDVSALSPGIYFIRISNGSASQTLKMIVNNLQ